MTAKAAMNRLTGWAEWRRERQHFPETLPDQLLNVYDWVRYLASEGGRPAAAVASRCVVAAAAVCPLCKRPARQHGHRPKQWRMCGPVSGTGAGAMTAAERARYIAGWPVKQS